MKRRLLSMVLIMAAVVVGGGISADMTVDAQRNKQRARQSQTSKRSSKSRQQKKAETSAEAKHRREAALREIRQTQAQIKENEKKVKAELAALGRIDADMKSTQQQISLISTEVNKLSARIGVLQSEITQGEKDLAKLRGEYLKAVKKMRLSKGNTSMLAFIFAAENFNQALRRLRYLKMFSRWREEQTGKINEKIKRLKVQTEELQAAKRRQDVLLSNEVAARDQLSRQRSEQNALVGSLKKNGQALQKHLATKQKEANALREQIAALIAQEQRREEERRRKEEAEQKRRQAEQEKRDEAAAQAKQEKSRNGKGKESGADKKSSSGKNYAEARKRAPRAQQPAPSASRGTVGTFAGSKGNLPRPASGNVFKITSPFGRHPLPQLPNVEYDNPGIDVQTQNGASAMAVYPGRVSGVYVLPGYSTVIIVNHGDYYTVYGNIESPSVRVGDNVTQGQALGRLATDEEEGVTMLHFEVWKNRQKLNPAAWIK